MGVDRVDYLMWGVKIHPDTIEYDDFEEEIDGTPDARFDMVYDGMGGEYAVAGKIIEQSDPYEGIKFKEISSALVPSDPNGIIGSVTDSGITCDPTDFKLYLFTHFH